METKFSKLQSKLSKRDAILNAMLDVVVERGFHEAPMSLIAKRSGASAGVIYHYFESKEAIIEAAYERARLLKRSSLLDGYSSDITPEEAMIHFWKNAYRFYRAHHKDMRFIEQCEAAGFVYPPGKSPQPEEKQIGFEKRFRSKRHGGILNNLPDDVLEEATLGFARRLAKQRQKLTAAELQSIAERVWRFVSE